MTEAEIARRRRASENFRNKRAAEGEAQVAVWLPESLKEQLDQVIRSGRFKNRSEATREALSVLLEQPTMQG